LPRWLKVIGLLALLLGATSAATAYALYRHLKPTWTEHYAVAGDRLRIRDGAGKPLPDVLVIRVAATGAPSGGWDISADPPTTGSNPWVSLGSAQLDLKSGYTDSTGEAAVAPFAVRCRGVRGPLGGHLNHGTLIVVAYQRGHGTAVLHPGVDTPARSDLVMAASRSTNADPQAEADWSQYLAIKKLLLPFSVGDDTSRDATRRYWKHVLPDGRTVKDFARDEAAALAVGSKTANVAQHAATLRDALTAGEPKSLTAGFD
jgi:hypothetical protein